MDSKYQFWILDSGFWTRNPRSKIQNLKSKIGLALILIGYLALGVAYASRTPLWQVPDEPAHYNYVVTVAETGQLPALQPGDYPFDYLEEIKSKKFPPNMPVDRIRYESHQPPLYYVLAALVYKATAFLPFREHVIALRLFSVLLGAGLLLVTYRIGRQIYPEDGAVALATVAFVAFLPMHLAMTAAINNDTLAELVLGLILLLALGRLRGSVERQHFMLLGGLLLGIGLLTKTTIYIPSAALLAAAELFVVATSVAQGAQERLKSLLRTYVGIGLIALLLSGWWFIRNAQVYGDLDIFGWGRHDAVAGTQLRTADWLAQVGWRQGVQDFAWTTFKSFWGIFGWMGVPMEERVYRVLLWLTAAIFAGLGLALARALQRRAWRNSDRVPMVALLAVPPVLAVGVYVWYNLKYVQHQGRYLFPAIIPIGLFVALGFRELVPRQFAGLWLGLLGLGLAGLAAYSLPAYIVRFLSP